MDQVEWQKWAIWLLPVLWAVWWLWWKLPKRETEKLRHSIRDPKARVDVEDTLRKTIGQALGGIVVLFGAGFGLVQFLDQRETAQKQIAISIQQVQASHDLLISNQVAKGFEQLGSDRLTIRLGGIYALEGVMNTSPQYYQPLLEAMCALVREDTINKPIKDQPASDIQAVLTVIARRTNGIGRVNWVRANLSGADLDRANLSDANLSNADLSSAYLAGANLSGSHLSDTDLHGANLEGTNLESADLSNANLSGADLIFANLSGAILEGTNLEGANLGGANLSAITPSGEIWINATLIDSNLSGADLSDANLSGTNLKNVDLSGADLTRANLSKVHNLIQGQLDKACGKPKELPPGLALNKSCSPPFAPADPLNP